MKNAKIISENFRKSIDNLNFCGIMLWHSDESMLRFKTKTLLLCLYKAGCFACDIDNSTEVSRASVFLILTPLFLFERKRGKKKQKSLQDLSALSVLM